MARNTTSPTPTPSAPPVGTLAVAQGRQPAAIRALGLRAGDLLLSVDGAPFRGDSDALARALQSRTPRLLTFQRDDGTFHILAEGALRAHWDRRPSPPADRATSGLDASLMVNWEILADPAGNCDIQRLRPSIYALVLPLLWLAQNRLWPSLATATAAIVVSLAVSPLAAVAVHLACGLFVFRSGAGHVRKDRAARGLWPDMVLAAPSEKAAIAAYQALRPGAHFAHYGARPDAGLNAAAQAG